MRIDRYVHEAQFLDKNHDGGLDASELGPKAFAAMDFDRSGKVSPSELSAYALFQEDAFVNGGGRISFEGRVVGGQAEQPTFEGMIRRSNAYVWCQETARAKTALSKRGFGARVLDVLSFVANLFFIPFKLIWAGALAIGGNKFDGQEIYYSGRLRALSQTRELAASQDHAIALLKTSWENIADPRP